MYRNNGVVVCRKIVFKSGSEKSGIFNKIQCIHKAFDGDF